MRIKISPVIVNNNAYALQIGVSEWGQRLCVCAFGALFIPILFQQNAFFGAILASFCNLVA